MSLVSCVPIRAGRSSSNTGSVKTRTKQFWIVTDTPNDDEAIVEGYAIASVGDYGHTHPNDADSKCTEISVSEAGSESELDWIATFAYSSVQNELASIDPLTASPQSSWDVHRITVIAAFDRDGNAIVNSVGDPFDPPPTVEIDCPILNYTRNETPISGSLAYSYNNKINADTFYGWPPGYARIAVTASSAIHNSTSYSVVTYVVTFNPLGYKLQILDAGYRRNALVGGSFPVDIIDDYTGERITSPVPLDGSGNRLAAGSPGVPLEFDYYLEANFSSLGLV